MIATQLLGEIALRREKLFSCLGENSIAIVFNGSVMMRNGDCEYPFRPSSDFYYLTGIEEPNAVAVFIPEHFEGEYFLFNLPLDPERERWTGKRIGQEKACEIYGADQAFPIETLENQLAKLFTGKKTIFYAFDDPVAEQIVHSVLKNLPQHSRTRSLMPGQLENISPIIRELRLLKSDDEIALMRKAAQISVQGHQQAMRACQPGLFEYQLEAELKYAFMQQGAKFEAYPSIVASGANACVMHYHANTAKLENGDLVLIDAGAEYDYYASDVTRTFPVNGTFTEPQRKIYEIVLAAQLAGIAAVRPGNDWSNIHITIARTITEGLVDLGILTGNIDDLLDQKTYQRFYIHNFGHWLGLDTHDPCEYQYEGNWRLLELGMVFTIEPGIYIPDEYTDVDPIWRGIGIRIEDDILVTPGGSEVLSQGLAKSIEEIEILMAEKTHNSF